MIRRFNFILAGAFIAGGGLATGCADGLGDEVSESELEGIVGEGAVLFNNPNAGHFNGNGRLCRSCHPSEEGQSGTLSPADVEALFQSDPTDPLFQHDGADVMGGDTFNRIRTHATVLVEIPLPPNVRIAGSDARSVTVARGIPTTMNTPAMDSIFQYDGRARSLQDQARGAILGHAQSTDVTGAQLDALASFQQTLFNRENIRAFAEDGVPLVLPEGVTDSEKRGRRFFIADGQTSMDMIGEGPQQICGWCHSGNNLDEMSAFAVTNIAPFPAAEGHRFTPILVAALNAIGRPRYNFEFTNPNGTVTTVNSPDPGLALITGVAQHNGFLKTPTVWGVKDTAPYFHDNSAKTLQALMNHYDIALFLLSSENPKKPPVIDLTEQQKADIIAYMLLL